MAVGFTLTLPDPDPVFVPADQVSTTARRRAPAKVEQDNQDPTVHVEYRPARTVRVSANR